MAYEAPLLPEDDDVKEISKGRVKKGLQWIVMGLVLFVIFALLYLKDVRLDADTKKTETAEKQTSIDKRKSNDLSVEEITKKTLESAPKKTPEPKAQGNPTSDIVNAVRAGSPEMKQQTAKNSPSNAVPDEAMRREAWIKAGSISTSAHGAPPPKVDDSMNGINKQIEDAIASRNKQPDGSVPSEDAPPQLPKTNTQEKVDWLQAQTADARTIEHTPVGFSPVPGKHIIFEGTNIPAVVSEVAHTDMPGKFSARIQSPVYDRNGVLIIPPGSIALGLANTNVSAGQSMIQAAFYRIILTNKKSIWLSGMQGSDAMGRSGIPGDVDNHFFKMFGASFAVAAIQGVFVKNDNSTSVNSTTGTVNVVTSSAGQTLSDVSREILQRNRSIPPTITLRPGDEFNIRVVRDITGEPYQAQ